MRNVDGTPQGCEQPAGHELFLSSGMQCFQQHFQIQQSDVTLIMVRWVVC